MPRRPQAIARLVALACAAALALAAPPRAVAQPELAVQLGRTFAVGSQESGAYDQGGFTMSLGMLWPWEDRFRFGFTFNANDFGSKEEFVSVDDPSGGPPKVYGTVDAGHRGAWGASWRADALGPRFGTKWRSYATATYGYYRYTYDHVGTPIGEESALGGSIGVGAERRLNVHHALGVSVSETWMSEDFTSQFASAAVEWRWHW